MALEKGVIVRLKSGGPKMTVKSKSTDGTWLCTWFVELEVKREYFDEHEIEQAK